MISGRKIKKMIIMIATIFFVAMQSGSMFQMIYVDEFNRLKFLLLFLLFGIWFGKSKRLVVRKKPVTIFLMFIFIISIIDMLMWFEYTYLVLYGANFTSFLLCYYLSECIPYSTWERVFINTITVLAAISLIGWAFSTLLATASFGLDLEGTWQYKSYIIFNIIKAIPSRNCGIFWEPGMYQGFLNFGILLIVMKRKQTFWDVIKGLILAITVLTTYSTTGYIVLLILGIYIVYRAIARINSLTATFFLIIATILFVGTDGFALIFNWAIDSLPAILTEKIVKENASFTTRIYSMLFDIYLGIRYPFGVGRASISGMVSEMAAAYGVKVTARTSTIATSFVYFGIVGGLAYSWLWIRGIFARAEKKMVEFIFVLLVMFLILNNEPMLFHLFFGTILFYWNQRNSNTGEVIQKYED